MYMYVHEICLFLDFAADICKYLITSNQIRNQHCMQKKKRRVGFAHLVNNISAHGLSVSDDRLLVFALAVPAIEFDAPTAGQHSLPVHFYGTLATELSTGQVSVVGRVDVVVGQRLVHVHVHFQPIQKHRRVLVAHHVSDETLFAHFI
jgi:hypothetical protein